MTFKFYPSESKTLALYAQVIDGRSVLVLSPVVGLMMNDAHGMDAHAVVLGSDGRFVHADEAEAWNRSFICIAPALRFIDYEGASHGDVVIDRERGKPLMDHVLQLNPHAPRSLVSAWSEEYVNEVDVHSFGSIQLGPNDDWVHQAGAASESFHRSLQPVGEDLHSQGLLSKKLSALVAEWEADGPSGELLRRAKEMASRPDFPEIRINWGSGWAPMGQRYADGVLTILHLAEKYGKKTEPPAEPIAGEEVAT